MVGSQDAGTKFNGGGVVLESPISYSDTCLGFYEYRDDFQYSEKPHTQAVH